VIAAMAVTPKEKDSVLTSLARRLKSSSSLGSGGEADAGAPEQNSTNEEGACSECRTEVLSNFELADDLERGVAAEAVLAKNAASPIRHKEDFRRYCIFHVVAPADEYHLLSETGDMILIAKSFRRKHHVEFYCPDEDSKTPADSSRRRPKFSMTYSENYDNWTLKQSSCEHCVQRPQHMSCEFIGKAQQVAFIQHSRRKIGKALVHYVAARLPALVNGTESMVWCPVTLGRDLCDRSSGDAPVLGGDPIPGVDPSPGKRHHLRTTSGGYRDPSFSSNGSGRAGSPSSPKGRFKLTQQAEEVDEDPVRVCTKVPEWNDYLESLVLDFKTRKVEACPMNFMLQAEADEGQQIIMQHAKLSLNTYCLDFRHPLSTVQAFAIALTALLWD